MRDSQEIISTYKVLEIREPFGGNALDPIVIVCENTKTKERRRIEVYRANTKNYCIAQLLTTGDVFSVKEHGVVLRRKLEEIVVCFQRERLVVNEH